MIAFRAAGLRVSSVLVMLMPVAWAGCGDDFSSVQGGTGGGVANGGAGGLGSGGRVQTKDAGNTGGLGSGGKPQTEDAGNAGGLGSGGRPQTEDAGNTGGLGAGGAEAGDAGPTVCSDNDKDGHTTCDGDCDDADATAFPGHPEICGDLVDNDCKGGADDPCQGIGTFVSGRTGADANPGTKERPVATLAKGIANAARLGGSLTVYVADAVYAETTIELVESVSLEGGYHCDTTGCDWSRNESACLTILRPESSRGVLVDETITNATRLDGFKIEGKTGAGVAGAGVFAGRVALTLDGGTPVVSNNCIQGPDVTSGTYPTGRSTGLMIVAPLNDANGVRIENNRITGGVSSAAWSEAVLIDEETAAAGKVGKVILSGNKILGGTGPGVTGITARATAPGSVFENNEISGGTGTAWSWAMRLEKGDVLVDANRINADANHPVSGAGIDTTGGTWSGGIEVINALATVTNNVAYGTKAQFSAALLLISTATTAGELVVSSNTFFGGSLDDAGAPVRAAAVATFRCPTCAASRGRFRNNIQVVQNGTAVRLVFWEAVPPNYAALQPEVFENNILRLSPQGVTNQGLYAEAAVATHTLIDAVNNMDSASLVLLRDGNLATDPKLDATVHVGLGSLARNNGTLDDAPDHDIDGDTRPMGSGYDIGADESQ